MSTEKLKGSHWHLIIIGVCGHSFRPPSRILISIISTMPSFVSTSMNVVKRTFSLPCRKQSQHHPDPIYIYQSRSHTQHTLTHTYTRRLVCFKSILARILFMPRFRIKSSNQHVFLCLLKRMIMHTSVGMEEEHVIGRGFNGG